MTGPFETTAIAEMLSKGTLDGSEEVSTDRQTWRPVKTVAPVAATGQPASAQTQTAATQTSLLDLGGDDDGIFLAPLELELADSDDAAGAPATTATGHPDPGLDAGIQDVNLEAGLELVERNPAPRSETATRLAPPQVRSDEAAPRLASGNSHASAAVAQFLQSEVEQAPPEATQPVRLDEVRAPSPEERVRRRTLTAARGGKEAAPTTRRWRPSRRVLLVGGGVVLVAALGAVTIGLDLPDRLRGEPTRNAVLGSTATDIAQDRFPAFSEGARLLEEAAGARRHVPATRAAAAELLASSVVIHGGERGRIAHAEVLLDAKVEPAGAAQEARARALAWVALAKGRWKDADRIVSETVALAESDRAVLRGWAALEREDASRAAALFQSAVRAEPAPFPSRVAARYGLARARESDLSPDAEDAYRAVLSEAPAHVGAALGLARVSKLSPAARLALAETVIAKQARDASRAELAEAHALVARAARDVGQRDKVDAALKRARDADPAGVAAAVLAGDILLSDGRTDEAVERYKLALAPPVSAPRTSWLRFARAAALVESERAVEASTALAELDRRLPGDARIGFWLGRAAERAHPPNMAAAERAYREALTRDPHFLPASLQLARLLLDHHRGADALMVLRQAEKQGAAAVTLRVALGQALLASGNATEAARTFRQAIAADAKNPTAHLGLAAALEAAGDLEGARGELAAMGARNDIPGLGSRVAAVLVKLGRKDEALAAYRKEIATGNAAAATKVSAARLALDLGQKDVAQTLAQAAVDDDPRTPGALLVLADVRRAEGDLGSALSELRRALAVDGSADVQLEYGRALAALGREEDALSAFAQAREIPEAAVERGRIFLRRGDVEGATKELAAATARLPSNGEAFLLLGQAEDRLGHVSRAEAAWRTAVRLAPRSPESRYRLGKLLMDEGQAAAALPHLRAAGQSLARDTAEAPNWHSDIYFQLGFAELRQGSRDRALAAFRHYLDIAPKDAPTRAEVTRQIHELAP